RDGERDNRFRRDDKPQWQDREARGPGDNNGPRKLSDKSGANRPPREEKPWQPREARAPRQFDNRDGERDNRFRRDDKPQWQNREERAPRDDNGPRKLFDKGGDNRPQREDKP
ncbi:hypothetical protein C3E98_043850, partial [Pseudomonas sp. MWU13-2625]